MSATVARLLLALALSATAGAQTAPGPQPFSQVFLIVLENTSFNRAIGNPNLPTLNALARDHGLATRYTGVAHPSLPNYLALLAGSTFGSHSDDLRQRFGGDNLALQLEAAGLSWKGYFQGLPGIGWDGPYAGLYGEKHNPMMLSSAIAADPERRQNVVPLEQLGADLNRDQAPSFGLIVPDVCHDLHGDRACPRGATLERAGDAFLKTWVDRILASSAWTGQAALVVTFDEGGGGDTAGGDGQVATIVVTRDGPRHITSARPYNHYSLLRTLEDGWGLPPLAAAKQARPMADLFGW